MAGRASDEAVKRATGKVWAEWFSILDKMGGRKMAHKNIAERLYEAYKPDLSGWWSQMVTVEYEKARGMREEGERASGKFSVSKSATINAGMERIYDAWNDPARRAKFARGVRFVPRSVRPPDVVRLDLPDDGSHIEVRITSKGASKCSVVVQHEDLPNAKAGERMKAKWAVALAALKKSLEA